MAALIWATVSDRLVVEAWRLPTVYEGDAHEMLARIQAASEGDLRPFTRQVITRLGAPFGAEWNAYPTPEKIPLYLLGQIARISDVFVAANLGLLFAFGLSAASFYWVTRGWLGADRAWAAAGALLFAFNSMIFQRGLTHFSFVLSWVIPLGLLACWLVARSSRLQWGGAGMWTCLAGAALLGSHNTYYLYFWLPLAAWAVLAQWFGKRRRSNLAIGVTCIAAALVSFWLSNFEYWHYTIGGEAAPILERNYGGTERYALKLVELFIPPGSHRLEPFAFLGQRYQRWSEVRGEGYPPYLGLAGICGLAWIALNAVPRLLRGRAPAGSALSAGWLLAVGTTGGLNNVLAFFGGLFAFRATNRIGIFIAAIALTFLVTRLSQITRGWRPAGRIAAAFGLALIGLLDQLPPSPPLEVRNAMARTIASDRTFGQALEARLPPHAIIYQLPVLPFPEAAPPGQLRDYEHFRPYLSTTTLRFSYGTIKFRPRLRWQQELEQLPTPELVRRLETLGFSALYLNRRGFDDWADALLRDLDRLGYRDRISSPQGNQIAVLLRPSSTPELPFARSLTYGSGWHNRNVDGVRWAHSNATLLFFNPSRSPARVSIKFWMRAPDERPLQLQLEGSFTMSDSLTPEESTVVCDSVLLHPGTNIIHLSSPAPAVRGKGPLRTFGIRYSTVTRLD